MTRSADFEAPLTPPAGDGTAPTTDHPDGRTNAEISNAVVGIFKEYLGRGPTRTQTSIRDGVVLVVLEDTLTKAEKTLASQGEPQAVLNMRRIFQSTMREEMTRAVEKATGRRVIAFMSDNHIDPDIAAEVFVLESLARNDWDASRVDGG